MQATRIYVMDTRNIAPGPSDNKLFRFSNALQVFACLCTVFGCEGDDLARCAADLMFTTLVGCMSAQVAHEFRREGVPPAALHQGAAAMMAPPQPQAMDRGVPQGYYGYGQQPQPPPIAMGVPVGRPRTYKV